MNILLYISFPHFLLHVFIKLNIKQTWGHIVNAILLRAVLNLG